MTVLCDRELFAAQDRETLVWPFNPDLIKTASIDLRLGRSFRVFHRAHSSIDLGNIPDADAYSHYVEEDTIVIKPGELMLGCTMETLRVPRYLVMHLEGKSTLARLGLLPHVAAGYFDPGWRGVGTLELVNLSPTSIILRAGQPICQSRWMRMSQEPSFPYGSAQANSHYQDATGVEGAKK